MNAIELNHVAKRYGDFALEDVNLTLPQGCVLGLIGENGAGKSTLIRMMLGACRPDGGEVRVLGEKAGRTAAFTKVRQDIGVVLDEACLPDELTAQQVGKVMHGIYANWDDAVFSSLCVRLDLPKGKKVKDFSRGTKMKLAIAVALSHKAKLLVLDEATGFSAAVSISVCGTAPSARISFRKSCAARILCPRLLPERSSSALISYCPTH